MRGFDYRNKDPKRQYQGMVSHAQGKLFERYIDNSLSYYEKLGEAIVEKTPEPMKPIKSLGNGRFISCFEKKAQPDYKGILKGGRTVVFEAKYTSTDRIEQSRLADWQAAALERYEKMGAICFILVGFASGEVCKVPWSIWRYMKEYFGHKYLTVDDLKGYRVKLGRKSELLIFG